MKHLPVIVLGVVMLLIYVAHYTLVVVPERNDRESLKRAMLALISGDPYEARVELTGEANSYFHPIR